MTERRWYEITYEQFARLFGFRREDANRNKTHIALCLDASKVRFMYSSNKRGSVGITSHLLPFYAYLNRPFRRTMTPREGDISNTPSYNQNLLVAMAPRPHRFDFSVFDFIWEKIKAISESPLKSCGYAPYIMHMIERVMTHTFRRDKEHHPLHIKNDLKAPIEGRRVEASPPSAARRSGQQGYKPRLLFKKNLASSLGYASPNTLPRSRLNMRGMQEGKTPSQ
jgi:hypothetical protein